ncbi:MAG: hypothetical protein GX162_07275 [Firmicutes bacterium]|nr:hypothetical protein [Bacillota bacterium]
MRIVKLLGGIGLNSLASLPAVTGIAVGSLLLAGLISATIAFFMPQRVAGWVRLGVEWATALSGAGYLALILTFRERISFPLCSGIIILSHLPLGVLLLLQALEPRGEEMAAGRALGLSIWQIGLATVSKASVELRAAIGLYASRLFADFGALFAVINGREGVFWAIALSGISMFCLQKSLATFVGHTGRPIYPPLFGPLPELPPRLRVIPRSEFSVSFALHFTLTLVAVGAMSELVGLAVLRTWITGGTQAELVSAPSPPGTMAKAFTDALIIVAGAGLITLVASRIRRVTKSKAGSHIAVCLAALSPIIWTYPVVISSRVKRPIRLSIAVVGLTAYALLQLAAARWAHAGAARRMLRLGQATTAAATGALGLPTQEPHRRLFLPAQILSSTAAWLASAAFLNALYFSRQRLSAAPALVWTLLAGVAQLGTLILRSFELRPRVREGDLSTTLEDLRHDAT